MNITIVKWLGLIGAALTGSAQILSGDVLTGVGVISAALSSAGVLQQRG